MSNTKSEGLSVMNKHHNHYRNSSLQEKNLETTEQNIDSFL